MSAPDSLGQRIAREQDALRAQASRAHDRALVRRHIASLSVRSVRPALASWTLGLREALGLRGSLALCGALAVAALFVVWDRPLPAEAPLRLLVGRSETPMAVGRAVGTWIEAPKLDPVRLRFSDGTRIDIAPHSRARLVELSARGAHLLLESGQARVQVVHKPNAAWRVSAGPFAVRVTGTRFNLGWNPELDRFELDLEEGHVEVSGCAFGQGYRMRAGQKVDASCARRSFLVEDRTQPKPSSTPAVTAPSAANSVAVSLPVALPATSPLSSDGTVASRARTGSSSASDQARKAHWREPAERGNYARAYAAATAAGFEELCKRANADELSMLADAARYARDAEREEYALSLLRRRYSGTSRAALAAFSLGRLHFDSQRSYNKAVQWFSTYLREQPRGALAREARGRLLEATLLSGDRGAARELGARYLRDYPEGPHADLARSLEEVPKR